jgi:FtsH-binding integral membrane protein
MLKAAAITGILLLIVGLIGFYTSETRAITALIPALMGILMLLCAAIGLNGELRKHAMHGAVLIALLGIVGPGMRLPKLFAEGPMLATVASVLTVLICVGFFILGIRSFINARRERKALEEAAKDRLNKPKPKPEDTSAAN